MMSISIDDIGASRSIDEAASVLANYDKISEWHVLVNGPTIERVPSLDPGSAELCLHLTITSGSPLSKHFPSELLNSNYTFKAPLQYNGASLQQKISNYLTQLDVRHYSAIASEFHAQMQRFICLFNRAPINVSVHQDLDRLKWIQAAVLDATGMKSRAKRADDKESYSFEYKLFNENVRVQHVQSYIKKQLTHSTTSMMSKAKELIVHPATRVDDDLSDFTLYRKQRVIEYIALEQALS